MMDQKVTMADLHARMVRIETRLVVLLHALGYDAHGVKQRGQSNNESKVVHFIGGTK